MKKKLATLSDKLNKLFAPEEQQQSEESGDETAPKFSEFDEAPDDAVKDAALSEFRKRNIRFLEEFDRKYKGAVSSRNETFDDEDDDDGGSDEDDDDEEEESDNNDEDDDQLEEDSNVEVHRKKIPKSKSKSIVLLKPPQSDDDDDEEDDSGEEDYEESSDDDQESLAHYTHSNKQQPSTQQMTLIKEENRQETINKGLAVQNQLKIWERLLEMRIKVQPCLIASNSLPPSSSVCQKLASQNEEFRQKSEQASQIISDTMDQLLELQEVLMGRFSETKTLLKSGSKRKASSNAGSKPKQVTLDEYEQILASRRKDMEEYRNGVLMKWHDRINIASKMRNNPRQSLSVLKKIEESLINREELVRKTQLHRGGYTLLGRQASLAETAAASEQREDNRDTQEQTPSSVYDGEIFDDSDFYHQMLRELIEYKTSTTDSPQEIANKLAELQKLRNKMKKTVDTKASKGRKIRYVVHNKLVNFMAPVPDYDWTDEAKDELFSSLFGQTPATEER
ncbi:protein Aatf [Anopheles maculipalpis]|uniref:protein Aatf n=1 Tax=Anopheles maculipalpis TaxID=1496333 RepID=UPI0021599F65|nr:protein Aatf [Anopheles maculipalpis]